MYGIGLSAGAGLSSNGIRQTDEKPDNFASLPSGFKDNDSMSSGSGGYKYTRLMNRSPSIYTNDSNTEEVSETAFGVRTMSKSESDQKIPDVVRVDDIQTRSIKTMNQKDLFCNDILLEIYKNNKDMLKSNLPGSHYQMDRLSVNRSVPNANDHLNLSFNTLNLEEAGDHHHVQRDMYGNVILNTSGLSQSSGNEGNNSLEISYDHVKYINVFSLLCCWCFPFTGIISVIYARLTSKYYKMRDLSRAKRYLERSEWMLILTFFFGFTLIALGFCFLEYYWFKNDPVAKSATRHFPYHLAKKFQ